MAKSNTKYFALAGMGLLAAFLFTRTQLKNYLDQLSYSVQKVKFIGFNTLRMTFQLRNNNTQLPLFLKSVEGNISYQNNVLANFSRSTSINISPGESKLVTLDFQLNYQNILQNVPNLLTNLSNQAKIKVLSNFNFGAFQVPYEAFYSLQDFKQ